MADTHSRPIAPQKPSFLSSVMAGIGGYIKGAVTGAVVGAVVIGAIAAVVGAVAPDVAARLIIGQAVEGGAPRLLMAGISALGGAFYGGAALGMMGGMAGAVTGVVQNREAGQPSAEDVVNVAKISFAQGVAVGHNIEHAAHVQHEPESTKFRDAEMKRRGAPLPERQVIN